MESPDSAFGIGVKLPCQTSHTVLPWRQSLPVSATLRVTVSLCSLRHLAQNPFMCDCHLKWLADFLFDNPIETSGARCSHPRRLANKRISQVKSKKFRCSGNQPPCVLIRVGGAN